MIKSHWRHGF